VNRSARPSQHFLFLQGVASPFFARLADGLREEGHRVSRVNFCAGDAFLWGRRAAWPLRAALSELPERLESFFARAEPTDLVLFGNRRPVHLAAMDMAASRRARVHVFEEGYIRPNWITLERGGVNGDSRLPRDPAWFVRANRSLPDYGEGLPVPNSLAARAAWDLAYHGANLANPLLFPRYRTHRPYPAAMEYAGWIRRFSAFPWRQRSDRRRVEGLQGRPYFLLPLQLNADAQIVHYSPFANMGEALARVLRSFAVHSPADCSLVVKNHPLDTGLFDYRGLIARLEGELDLRGRVVYLETGPLPDLARAARGVVTVNSTVGLSALGWGCPTQVLGQAIYDLPGLTARRGLDAFWSRPVQPDAALLKAFRNVVIHCTQVNGGFYTRAGIEMAVAGCGRLLGERSPLEELLP
jgi:capsular polysaccharide export protein